MKKYRKKIYVCLTLSALALATGCSNKAIKANAENTENVVSSTQAENTGEASAQTVVEKAKITFSDSGAQIEGSGASYADGTLTITEAGSYTLEGSNSNAQVVIDALEGEVTLVLNGVNLQSQTTAAIYAKSAKKVNITLADGSSNTLVDAKTYTNTEDSDEPDAAVFADCDLSFDGSGTLEVTANAKDGIKSKDNLTFTSGTYTITSADNAIKGKNSIAVKDGIFTINATGKGMTTEGTLDIDAGKIDIQNSEEGLEGKQVTVNGGDINIVATDDGINARTKTDSDQESMQAQEDTWFKLEGGNITVDATGDGVDSNGDIYINGGTIMVYGPTSDGDGTLDYDGTATITGGTYMGIGSSGMIQSFGDTSTQNSLEVNYSTTQKAGTVVKITDESGNVIANITAKKDFSSVLISSSDLSEGKKVTIQTGEDKQTATISGKTTTVGEKSERGGAPGQGTPEGNPPSGNSSKGNPPEGNPPSGQPPEGNPPSGKPPKGNPPSGKPPKGNPPSGKPPKGNPPSGKPPKGNPPSGKPPKGNPPSGDSSKGSQSSGDSSKGNQSSDDSSKDDAVQS